MIMNLVELESKIESTLSELYADAKCCQVLIL